MSPADYGRALARDHTERYPLTEQQVADAARILAAVARERAQDMKEAS